MRNCLFFMMVVVSCAACKKKDTPAPAPEGPVKVYKDVAFTNFFRRTNGWIAGDVAFSIPLRNQQVMWLFGDSYIDNYDAATQTVPCLFQVNNAGLLHTQTDLVNAATLSGNQPGIKSYFKNSPDATNKKLWPGNGYLLGDTVYVYLQGIQLIPGGGSFGFIITGEDYMAKIKYPEMTVASYTALPFMDSVFYGSAIVKEPNSNTVYAYGVKNEGLGSNVYLAKFDATNPTQNWQFWNGTGWSTNQAVKQKVANGYSYSVHVSKIRNKYVLLSSYFSVGCNQGKEVHSQVADQPQGPFTSDKKLFDITDSLQGHLPFFYFPVAHPEFINGKNELLVTYCINGYTPCLPDCTGGRKNPDTYRPKAMRVPLELINASLK
jgi:hypothetical protein